MLMQGGKLMISRGMPGAAEAVPVRREPEQRLYAVPSEPARPRPAPVAEMRDAPAPDYHLIHYRLAALERLSLLRDKGALSPEEYEAEKALILRLPAEELELGRESILPRRGPSLLGRLFGWKLLLAGLLTGIGFVAATAPQDLLGLLDQVSHFLR
jgi:hypothetical protein